MLHTHTSFVIMSNKSRLPALGLGAERPERGGMLQISNRFLITTVAKVYFLQRATKLFRCSLQQRLQNIVIFKPLMQQFRPNSRMFLTFRLILHSKRTTLAKEINKVVRPQTKPSHPSSPGLTRKNILRMTQFC